MSGLGAGPLLARARDLVGPALLWGKKAAGRCTRTCSSTHTPEAPEGPARRRSYWRYVRRLVQGAPEPPYPRVCQVGDPALRAVAAPVEPAQLAGPELQQLVQLLVQVMRRRRCVGLSAPQLGVPLQVLALELPEALCRACAPHVREAREMEPFPLRVFVNPSLRVLDSRLVTFPEGCESVAGFLACVPRFQAVQISGAGWLGERVRLLPVEAAALGPTEVREVQFKCRHVDGGSAEPSGINKDQDLGADWTQD